ncbi:hypothetical protein CBM2625_B50059 [Cupriavidus taiwanensis]|uniref:Uncharacterized protein n=1 Tax=Cupriavidus taiwanensis TaxID=164546 RepID=A0A976B2X4_9BURK|nr:hypothetical protein CBM2613_B50060 [Cupriavidus taiwanensis]SPA09770.1 hypothetical protein CBM2625_B50059 [Cupriavidus taiwanensis]
MRSFSRRRRNADTIVQNLQCDGGVVPSQRDDDFGSISVACNVRHRFLEDSVQPELTRFT